MPKLFSTFGEVRRRFASVRDQLAEELRRELGPGFLRGRGAGFMTYDMFGEPSEPRLENKRWAEFSAREFDYLISLVETMHAEVAEIRVCGAFDFSKTMQVDRPTPVDVRIVSATHVDMQTAMIEGRFRADLYHRLCALQIIEPPLRERGKDVEFLAKHMLEHFKKDARRRLRGFSPRAIAAIEKYGWPVSMMLWLNSLTKCWLSRNRRIGCRASISVWTAR